LRQNSILGGLPPSVTIHCPRRLGTNVPTIPLLRPWALARCTIVVPRRSAILPCAVGDYYRTLNNRLNNSTTTAGFAGRRLEPRVTKLRPTSGPWQLPSPRALFRRRMHRRTLTILPPFRDRSRTQLQASALLPVPASRRRSAETPGLATARPVRERVRAMAAS
jgi:hypothetical protein